MAESLVPVALQVCPVKSVISEIHAVKVEAQFKVIDEDADEEPKNPPIEFHDALCLTLCAGVTNVKYVHNFCEDDQVLCIFGPTMLFVSAKKYGAQAVGFAVGTFYTEQNPPPVVTSTVHQVSFEGGEIRIHEGELKVRSDNDVTIFADNIRLN